MNETLLGFEAKKYSLDKIKQMYAAAPGAFYKAIRHRMYSERKRYIGNRSSPEGRFRRELLNKRHSGTGIFARKGKWPVNVARAAKGYLSGAESINNMFMRMGVGLKKQSGFTRGLALMDAAYLGSRTIHGGGKQMPIPVYKNLLKVQPTEPSTAFRKLSAAGRLIPINKCNKTLWFLRDGIGKHKEQRGRFKPSALLFVGTRSVTIKPQFNFGGMFRAEMPAIINRAQNEIDGTVRRLMRGDFKSGDFIKTPGHDWQ